MKLDLKGIFKMKKHYVIYYSPGSFVAETDTIEIPSWNIEMAVKKSKEINQRHGAKPYGFRFHTKERKENDWEPKITKESGMYYLEGKLCGIKDLDPVKHRILISNMKMNKWEYVVKTNNSYEWFQPFEDNDILLEEK